MHESIPDDIRPLWGDIWQQVSWLHITWSVYRQVFGTSESRISLLNEMAPTAFRLFQDALLDDVVLTISRLTDSRRVAGHDTATLDQLLHQMRRRGDAAIVEAVAGQCESLKTMAQPIRQRRHNLLAHRNLAQALEASLNPIDGVSRRQIKTCIQAIGSMINAVQFHYCRATTLFDKTIVPDDGEDLIHALLCAAHYEKLKGQGILAAHPLPREEDAQHLRAVSAGAAVP